MTNKHKNKIRNYINTLIDGHVLADNIKNDMFNEFVKKYNDLTTEKRKLFWTQLEEKQQ